MKRLHKNIIEFIDANRICVLTTLLEDGKPHSATMHFAFNKKTNEFVFFTKEKSRKCNHFNSGEKRPASLVVGFSEEEWKEFQLEGEIEKISKDNSKPEEKVFANKFPGAKLDNEHIVLKLIPTWWRFTEFKPNFKVISSDDK